MAKSERVTILVPRASSKEDPNFVISVNGKNYVIPRGKPAEVPPEVAFEYQRSLLAIEKYEDLKAGMVDAAQKAQA